MTSILERFEDGRNIVSAEIREYMIPGEVLPAVKDATQYYTDQIVYIGDEGGELPAFANAGCAVMNAVLALGIHPRTDVAGMYRRLLAAHRGDRSHGGSGYLNIDQNNFLWTTSGGLEQLTKIIKAPIDLDPTKPRELPITVTPAFDPGIIHQALMHEYKGVYIDPDIRHAVTLVGAKQTEDEATWYGLFPDPEIIRVEREINPGVLRLQDLLIPPVLRQVNPVEIIDKEIYPVYLIGRNDNPWRIPPEPPGEITGEMIVID